ncbi:hypothetical protein ANCDUO_04815 [Ancylostoma duodenale]|uniref:Neurotransmitter-gated ion-channel ligand-binding domain-containing protein n=1 Tax=Ancylostoma duodenale TaxID=51022 RepID=A0A0C2GU65_9BILA|nr:hypothetical protein ANCDUO_04815 [Ancylostoma duodenale]
MADFSGWGRMLTRQVFVIAWAVAMYAISHANRDANRLFEDLLADYNKLVRPVDNNSDTLVVRFKLKLSQLLDVVGLGVFCWRSSSAQALHKRPRLIQNAIIKSKSLLPALGSH